MQLEANSQQQFIAKPLPTAQEKEMEGLLEIERQARQNSNMETSQITTQKILNILIAHNDPVKLINVVKALATKRGQIIRTVTELVRASMSYVDKISDEKTKIYFVTELKSICDKKIYVEVEYARCAMILVKHNERNNMNLEEAAKIMENVQVETYGSMTKREKVEFILYQMHIQFILGDEIKLTIVSKKINPKMLNEPGFQVLKLNYYLFLFYLNLKLKNYKDCSSNLENALEGLLLMTDANAVQDVDPLLVERYPQFLDKNVMAESILVFKALEEHNLTKIEALDKLKGKYDGYLVKSAYILPVIESFLSKELTSCNLNVNGLKQFPVFEGSFYNSSEMLRVLKSQLVKKNLVIIAQYFKNSRLQKLANILETDIEELEDDLCDLIVEGIVKAKIDRPSGIVNFVLTEISNDDEMIDSWVKNINEIVDIIDLACERIEHEDVLAK